MSVDHDGHLRQPIFNLPLVQSVLKLSDVLERHTHIRLLPDPRTRRHLEPSINLDEVRPEPVGLELAQVPLSRTSFLRKANAVSNEGQIVPVSLLKFIEQPLRLSPPQHPLKALQRKVSHSPFHSGPPQPLAPSRYRIAPVNAVQKALEGLWQPRHKNQAAHRHIRLNQIVRCRDDIIIRKSLEVFLVLAGHSGLLDLNARRTCGAERGYDLRTGVPRTSGQA